MDFPSPGGAWGAGGAGRGRNCADCPPHRAPARRRPSLGLAGKAASHCQNYCTPISRSFKYMSLPYKILSVRVTGVPAWAHSIFSV
ncbi:hypothetical protein EVAR_59787_1 [Eumeta japonica]|uniref:Uncharacterized protein n=1 Tax=Eumeta variegata TaxID=151549 RepID=A0A4C1YE11_EUMVA|nr:hypothetical protein EVAR_59787_1 [Eumeta japonica]